MKRKETINDPPLRDGHPFSVVPVDLYSADQRLEDACCHLKVSDFKGQLGRVKVYPTIAQQSRTPRTGMDTNFGFGV
uniref:Transposase n=1 Tax=Panagrellus redivivus TaxID=6233 RepID=A0A7E4UWU8_PANRE